MKSHSRRRSRLSGIGAALLGVTSSLRRRTAVGGIDPSHTAHHRASPHPEEENKPADNAPYLLRAGRRSTADSASPEIEELSTGGMVVGMFPDMEYEEATLELCPVTWPPRDLGYQAQRRSFLQLLKRG